MNSTLLQNASKVIPIPQVLINVVRLRVRQLTRGSRPLIEVPPGMGFSDIALTEVAHEKLTYAKDEPTPDAASAPIVSFPTSSPRKKAA